MIAQPRCSRIANDPPPAGLPSHPPLYPPVWQCFASRSADANTASIASLYSVSSYSSAVRTSSRRRPPFSLQAWQAQNYMVSRQDSGDSRSTSSSAAAGRT